MCEPGSKVAVAADALTGNRTATAFQEFDFNKLWLLCLQ
jgi:hypothetical protein